MILGTNSPLYALVNAHVLLGGPILGLVGFGVLRLRDGLGGWRPAAWLIGAKTVSTVLLVVPLSVAFGGLLPRLLGSEPLVRLPWLLGAFGLLLALGSSLLEWPFFHRAAATLGGRASLGRSLRANAVCLALLAAVYLPACRLSLLGLPRETEPRGAERIQTFYLRDGALYQRGSVGPELRLGSVQDVGGDARLFARRGEMGWDLWIQERDRAPRLLRSAVAPATAQAPQQPALHVKLKQGVRTTEPALPETFGKPAEAVPESDSAWSIQLGEWPHQGLQVQSRDLRGAYDLALDTPWLSWDARCSTRLPGDRLLVQMGPYLWLLDLETRRLHCFAKGQGAQVILG
jgi:hypothetical protein